ncbi:hypothetical protein ACFPIJ_27635 [Dactylosporangium cerinum]|uniref:Uncharacterized protein n=1 Tax=Dactylosporangium cerinum TaxID=1434730 RepID=A0ABV9W170_9ACTN
MTAAVLPLLASWVSEPDFDAVEPLLHHAGLVQARDASDALAVQAALLALSGEDGSFRNGLVLLRGELVDRHADIVEDAPQRALGDVARLPCTGTVVPRPSGCRMMWWLP